MAIYRLAISGNRRPTFAGSTSGGARGSGDPVRPSACPSVGHVMPRMVSSSMWLSQNSGGCGPTIAPTYPHALPQECTA
jgi:hypothetical protein